MVAILDLADDNPISRVPKSIYKDVKNMRLEMSIQNNINVAQAKKAKEELLRKKLQDEERKKYPLPIKRPSKPTVITPGAESRINKLYRGQSSISVAKEIEPKQVSQKQQKINRPSSAQKSIPGSKTSKKRPKKKLNVKKSVLAEHFSQKNDLDKSKQLAEPILIAKNYTSGDMDVSDAHNVTKHSNVSEKQSIQNSSRSYFRIGKNVEKNYFRHKPHSLMNKGEVKGEDKFLKSRAKPVRASVKLNEVRPVGLYGITAVGMNLNQNANTSSNQDTLDNTDNPLSINSYKMTDNG